MTEYAVGDRVEIFTLGFPVNSTCRGSVISSPSPGSGVIIVHCDSGEDSLFVLDDTRHEGGPVDGVFRVEFKMDSKDAWQYRKGTYPTRALAEESIIRAKRKWNFYDIRIVP